MSKLRKLTPAESRRIASTSRPARRASRTTFEKMLERRRVSAPALLDYQLRRALTDPTTPDRERARLTQNLLQDHLVWEEVDHRRGGVGEAETPPETAEEVRVLEAEAERLRTIRVGSYADRAKEAREARKRARVEASGTSEEGDGQD